MRTLLVSLLLTSLALAGCTGDNSDTEDCVVHEHDGIEETHGDCAATEAPLASVGGNETAVDATDLPPVAQLSATALNGTAPLEVSFELTGNDPEGAAISWNLTWNATVLADGSVLPAVVNHTFGPGNHTVVFSVTDGNHTTRTEVLVVVTEFAAPAGPEPIFRVFDLFEGCDLCVDGAPVFNGADGCIGWRLQMNEEDCAWLAFGEEYVGTPFSVFSYTDGNLPLFGTDGRPDLEFRTGCGTSSQQISKMWGGGDTKTGIIPEGARCIVVYEFHWPNLGHTIEISVGADVHSE